MFKDAGKSWVQANGGDFVNVLQKEYGRTFTDEQRQAVLGVLREKACDALVAGERDIRRAVEGQARTRRGAGGHA